MTLTTPPNSSKGAALALTVSAVLVLAITAFFLLKTRAVGALSALAFFLFGFFTAGTGAYGPIHSLCESAVSALTHVHF